MLHASATSTTGSGSNSIGLQPSSCCCCCCCYGRQHCTPIPTRKHDAVVNVRCRSSDAATLVILDASLTVADINERSYIRGNRRRRCWTAYGRLIAVRSSCISLTGYSTSFVPWHMQCYARVSSPFSAQQQVCTDHPIRAVMP